MRSRGKTRVYTAFSWCFVWGGEFSVYEIGDVCVINSGYFTFRSWFTLLNFVFGNQGTGTQLTDRRLRLDEFIILARRQIVPELLVFRVHCPPDSPRDKELVALFDALISDLQAGDSSYFFENRNLRRNLFFAFCDNVIFANLSFGDGICVLNLETRSFSFIE